MHVLWAKLLRVVAVTIVVWWATAGSAAAQWYRTYDEALQAVEREDWAQAQTKLEQAKEEARRAGAKPGRSVLRYGMLREPFLPDFFLARAYLALAEGETNEEAKRSYYEKALAAAALAEQGQVRHTDPEFEQLKSGVTEAREFIAAYRTPQPAPQKPVIETPRRTDADELSTTMRRLLERADTASANSDWQAAVDALQDASRRLDTAPASLRTEFPQVGPRLAEATFARDLSEALQALRSGRFASARDSLERLQRAATSITFSSAITRNTAAGIAARLDEARAAQSLVEADAAFRERRWSAAARAYESAERSVASVQFTSPPARALAEQIPARRRETTINAALEEGRFGEVLAINPTHRGAAEGQYAKAVAAYVDGRWQEAANEFGLLLTHVPRFRDAVDRKAAADLQVEYGLGVAAEQNGDAAAARQHYDRVVALQQTIRGPLLESAAIVRSVEGASDRLRVIDAQRGLETARRQYENGQWDEAINSVNLVLRLLPGNGEAAGLLRRLNDRSTGEEVQRLTRASKEALARNELDAASSAATQLQALLPANEEARYVLGEVARLRGERTRQYQWLAGAGLLASIGPLLLAAPRRRGRFFAAIGRPTAALRLYERVLAKNPTDGVTLSRAAALAAKHSITAPLQRHFDTYLQSRPEDLVVAADAASYFWRSGEQQRAVDLYARFLNRDDVTLPHGALARLSEFHAGALPADIIAALERRYGNGASPALIAVLAQQYAHDGRTDATALTVYRDACALEPRDAALRISFARALLAADDRQAVAEAGVAAQLALDEEALDLLADAHVHFNGGSAAAVTEHLERLSLPTHAVMVVGERVVAARPGFRTAFSALYAARSGEIQDAHVSTALRLHAVLDQNALGDADTVLQQQAVTDAASRLHLRTQIDVHRRYLAHRAAANLPADTAAIANLARLYAAGSWWDDAIRAWQTIVSVPEWNRRSMDAIAAIVNQLALEDMVQAYFVTSDWQVEVGTQSAPADVRVRVSPGPSLAAELKEQFAKTPVFCHSTLVTVDDIVDLKRRVVAATQSPQAALTSIAFLVSTHAVRHDVYALIYAFMTEDPAVTIIPLEAQHLRDAIIEARSQGHLERTLHQWLGHTDIYETHNPVSNAATFFGRGHFINQLVLKISRGENFGIFGLRKIGKTSLVYRLRELSRDHLVAYVDLQGVSSRRTVEVYRRLVESLARDMRVKYPALAVPPLTLPDNPDDDRDAVASRFHADVIAIRRALEASVTRPPNMLLLLDEIELMVPYGASPGFDGHQEFFRHIRGLFQQEGFIVSAIVGATPMVCRTPKWDGRDNPVFQFYDEVFLAMLDRVECDQMVQGLGELMGVRFSRGSLDLIYAQTAGHPYVTRQLCSRLVRLFPERPLEVAEDMVATAIEEYLAQRGDYFSGIIEGYLDDDSRRVVEAIAMADAGAESRSRIMQRFDATTGRHLVDRVLGDLELIGLVTRSGDAYALRAPLFRRWLRRSWLGIE